MNMDRSRAYHDLFNAVFVMTTVLENLGSSLELSDNQRTLLEQALQRGQIANALLTDLQDEELAR